MKLAGKTVTIAVSVVLQDAGEATRSLEILRGIRDAAPEGFSVRAIFFSHGSRFEDTVRENGFEIRRVEPALSGEGYIADLKPSAMNFVGSPALAAELLKGEIAALKDLRPDLVLHGFWPFAGIARRMLEPALPGVAFLPLPLHPSLFGPALLSEVPDQIKPLACLPAGLRRAVMRAVPASFLAHSPIMRQSNLLAAARACGWKGEPLQNLFDMLSADLTVINDYAGFYDGLAMPRGFVVTGPVFAANKDAPALDPAIQAVFDRKTENQVNLFCAMGSSAKKEFLKQAAEAVAALPDERFHAVILAPKAVCPIDEITPLVRGRKNTVVTDRFVPAAAVNAMADICVCHGGQGTLQTAAVSGCPVVGFGMQPEQQINLDHFQKYGAGLRIPAPLWKKRRILAAINRIAADDSFKRSAVRLGQAFSQSQLSSAERRRYSNAIDFINGREKAAEVIWDFIREI